MGQSRLVERFVRHCEIASVTGDERAMADAVLAELAELGVDVTEDDAAEAARAGAGNLIARIPGAGEGWIMFDAHLDTVPHSGPIEVVDDGGLLHSRGDTILGADNKAAVAVLLELAARHAAAQPPVGIELLFTVAEEQGLRGAHALDVSALHSDVGFVLDHATPIGEVITAAPTYKLIEAHFRGTSAHAGLSPEQGHSAIAAAAAAVSAMELGRLDSETTANVGEIGGGTAPNVVPGECLVRGEARSVESARAAEVAGAMVEACTWAAGEHSCDVDVNVSEMFRGYRLEGSERSLALAEAGLRAAGIEPTRRSSGGGSDANALRLAGFDAVLIANGTTANHTPEEAVTVGALEEMLRVCEAIVVAAAA